jgi:tetratricopeptide (TPR) repeat protein
MQGFYTLLAYFIVFLMMRRGLRSREQLERLIWTMIAASVAIASYGLLQHANLDPLPWAGDVTSRVTSTLGNAIFLGAYLIMITPLTAVKLIMTVFVLRGGSDRSREVASFRLLNTLVPAVVLLVQVTLFLLYFVASSISVTALWWAMLPILVVFVGIGFFIPRSQPNHATNWLSFIGWLFVLLFQLYIVFLTFSRGPWFGIVAGGIVMAVLVSVFLLPRWTIWLMSGISAFCIIILASLILLLNISGGPFESVKHLQAFERLGSVAQLDSGTFKVRVLIWRGVGELMTTLPSIGLEDDSLKILRPLVGYGPESMSVAYNKVYPPELAHIEYRTASPDRSHNDLLDYLVTTGIFGLVAYLALFLLMVWTALRYLARAPDTFSKLLLIGLISALVAHFVEAQVGIVIVSTRLLFWVYAALIVVTPQLFRLTRTTRDDVLSLATSDQTSEGTSLAYASAATGSSRSHPARESRRKGVVRQETRRLSTMQDRNGFFTYPASSDRTACYMTVLGFAVFTLALLGYLMLTTRSQSVTAIDARSGYLIGIGWGIGGLLILARGLDWRQADTWFAHDIRRLIVYGGLIVVGGVLIWMNTNVVLADIYYKQGLSYDAQAESYTNLGRYTDATKARLSSIQRYRQAIATEPSEDFYYLFLGRAYIETARLNQNKPATQPLVGTLDAALNLPLSVATGNPLSNQSVVGLSRDEDLELARAVLERAYEINPLNTDHLANLARLYRTWCETDKTKIDQVEYYYRLAVQQSPRSALIMAEWADAELRVKGDINVTLEKLRQAEAIDPEYVRTFLLLGDTYTKIGKPEEALNAHSRALQIDPNAFIDQYFDERVNYYFNLGKGDSLAEAFKQGIDKTNQKVAEQTHGAYGVILAKLGKPDLAVVEMQIHAKAMPQNWAVQRNLALIYRDLGRYQEALTAAQKALTYAPAEQNNVLRDLVDEIKAKTGK